MPIEVEEIVRKPRPKSNPAISMVNSSKQKKSFFPKVNPIHELI